MRELKAQFVSALLFILTVAAVCCAIINFRQQSIFHLPTDGVTWVGRDVQSPDTRKVVALAVEEDGPAAHAGLEPGDVLVSINGLTIKKVADVPLALSRSGLWNKVEYRLERRGVALKTPLIVGERVLDSSIYYQY